LKPAVEWVPESVLEFQSDQVKVRVPAPELESELESVEYKASVAEWALESAPV
jgi:hypothetical protein